MLHDATATANDELCFADAHRLVAMLRERTVSAVELLRAFLAQIATQHARRRPPIAIERASNAEKNEGDFR